MGITVIGSLNCDLVTYTDRVPDAGETFRANNFETHAGGKGLNQTVAIAKLKDPSSQYLVRMVGSVGKDAFGEELLDTLRANNVDCSKIAVYEELKTGIATILVEQRQGGQNRILITEGANGKSVYGEEDLEKIFPAGIDNKEPQYVVLQHEIPDPCSIMRWIRKADRNIQTVFNPSPFQPLDRDDWKLVDILIINEIEALQIVEAVYSQEQITNYKKEIAKNFTEAYRLICADFQKHLVNQENSAVVIITLGAQGALFASKNDSSVGFMPAKKDINVVDTTGAGDTFLGSVVTQLSQGVNIKDAVKFATTASSITIQNKGAAESIPHFAEVSAKLY